MLSLNPQICSCDGEKQEHVDNNTASGKEANARSFESTEMTDQSSIPLQ